MIAESVFEANAVRPLPDAKAVDLTVRLNTGGFLIDPNIEVITQAHVMAVIPIWRIDDGPVHGIAWELCLRAQKASLTAVSKGFPPSWPSDLPCANISYTGPGATYSHAVSLAAGAHTLWTGLLVEARPFRLRTLSPHCLRASLT